MKNQGFDNSFTEDLKSKCDIVSTISKFITLQKKGKTYWACCPFHYEKTPSFAINEVEQYYHCFGCGESGDVIKFVSKYENLTFIEAVKSLADSCGLKLPEYEDNLQELQSLKQKEKVLKALNFARDFYKANLKLNSARTAIEYLQKRLFTKEVVEYFNIGVSLDWNSLISFLLSKGVTLETMKLSGLVEKNESGNNYDVFGKRLMFPIENAYGDCIGFTARTLEKDANFAKYKNSPQTIVFDKSKTIYNIKTIKALKKEQKIDSIIICEGTVDVIAMYKANFKNCVACLGTALTLNHAKELKKYTDKIILCLDGDTAGQNAMFKAIDILSECDLEVRAVKLKDNLDPDEYLKIYGAESLKEVLNNSIDAYEYKLISLSKRFDLKDTYQKNKFIKESFQIINNFDLSSQKDIYLKILSNIVSMPIDILRRDLLKNVQQENLLEKNEDSLPNQKNAYVKAIDFIISSIVHKKDYALKKMDIIDIDFLNPTLNKMFDFVKNSVKSNKIYTISSLFDYFDSEDEVVKKILN